MPPRSVRHARSIPRLTAAGLVVAASCFALTVRADEVHGTRSSLLHERSHDVSLTMAPGRAKLVVRRTVYNGGPRHDQAVFDLFVPRGSVAVGLRTLGSLAGRPHWFAGDLMEAEAAAAKYRELTGIGGYYPKDPALLSWRSQDHLKLQVFPCPPDAHKSVEYTLALPTSYHGGRHHLSLPRMGTDWLPANVRVHPERNGDRLWLGKRALAHGARLRLGDDGYGDLELAPGRPPRLDGALAVVPFAKQRVLTRYRIEAAPELSALPRRARVVVLLDGSRSVRPAQLEASVAAASAYLSHFRDARVEVLTFDRAVHRRYGRFVRPSVARADLETYRPTLHNGSYLDRALAEAGQLLSREPAETPKRIVLLTDGRARSSLTTERLAASARAHPAIVHVGLVAARAPSLGRDDEHDWAAAVRPTGGLVWQAAASPDPADGARMKKVYEELARPLRLHRLRLNVSGADAPESWAPGVLDEGESLVSESIRPDALRWVKIEGELWAEPVRQVLVPDAAEGKLWAALVFGSDLLYGLSEPEMMTLAKRGGAVSPVTSYLAIEPGVRPSTEGLDWGTGSGFGSGHGRLGRSHRASPARVRAGSAFDPEAFLRDKLGEAWQRCGGGPGTAEVTLETTLDEVVDVPSIRLDSGPDPVAARCLEEGVWALDLPADFEAAQHRWTVRI
ncbi:MAG: VWA domain-containing protein [Deltaproteobacteria bacterium]|jgi:hypothetical protein|nr:VWA domain-containing protein [Deltaproteobacteria bacterium]MBW2532596.1 VWA domain-containing protein [Deltaproteobacteria bacterium]